MYQRLLLSTWMSFSLSSLDWDLIALCSAMFPVQSLFLSFSCSFYMCLMHILQDLNRRLRRVTFFTLSPFILGKKMFVAKANGMAGAAGATLDHETNLKTKDVPWAWQWQRETWSWETRWKYHTSLTMPTFGLGKTRKTKWENKLLHV